MRIASFVVSLNKAAIAGRLGRCSLSTR